MNGHLITTFAILIIAVALFLSEMIRADVVALLVVVALGLAGVLTPQEAFSGFSRSAVMTLLGIFILAEGLGRTGVTEQVGNLLLRVGGAHETRLVLIVMLAGGFLSHFMNNIAAASVLLPAVSGAARKSGVNASRLLMPLAFATILGGMATLLTTTNIVVSSLLRDEGLPGYTLLSFAPIGLPLVLIGFAYLALWGRRQLPAESISDRSIFSTRQSETDLIGVYRLSQHLFRARIPAGSALINKPLSNSTLRENYGLTVVAIERNGRAQLSPPPDATFRAGDVVMFEGDLEEFRRKDVEPYLEILPPRDWRERDLESPAIIVVEAMLSPRSGLNGHTLRDTLFRQRHGMNVLAIWRAGEQIGSNLADTPLQFGDALLLQGPRSRLPVLRAEPDLIVLAGREEETVLVAGKGRLAIAVMLLTLSLAAVAPAMVAEIMLGGALLMVLTRVLTMDDAYQAVDWRSIFLVAGMLPMSIAMAKTGAAALMADGTVSVLGRFGAVALLAGFVVLAMLLTQAMSGAAVAAVLAPIAIQGAQQIGADPRSMAMGVALATSVAFITPLGHAVNVLVMGPGGYTFRHYVKVGLPLALLLTAAIIILLPIIWPLKP